MTRDCRPENTKDMESLRYGLESGFNHPRLKNNAGTGVSAPESVFFLPAAARIPNPTIPFRQEFLAISMNPSPPHQRFQRVCDRHCLAHAIQEKAHMLVTCGTQKVECLHITIANPFRNVGV